jgi:hypothetical protein
MLQECVTLNVCVVLDRCTVLLQPLLPTRKSRPTFSKSKHYHTSILHSQPTTLTVNLDNSALPPNMLTSLPCRLPPLLLVLAHPLRRIVRISFRHRLFEDLPELSSAARNRRSRVRGAGFAGAALETSRGKSDCVVAAVAAA